MRKILIVEDDRQMRQELKIFLDNNGYEGHILADFSDVPGEVLSLQPDLVLLDIKLPGQNGQMILRELRRESQIPVIMVTSMDSEMDEVVSMSWGADDYITKPYNPTLLLLHVEALFKRLGQPVEKESLTYRNVKVNFLKSTLETENGDILLSKNEITIFRCLLLKQGQIVSRDELMDDLWDNREFVDDNTLTVNINRLRRKLEEIGLKNVVQTRRSQGYVLI
ncbi:MAG: response regulator transcription factor [Eubacteriales bacterium]|nr:response regulator transcription factor [Eubacteriales bacterium]